MNEKILTALCEMAGNECVLCGEPMSRHTTFRIGGPADYYVSPGTPEALAAVVGYCRKEQIPFYIIGNGSNLLVGDGGYRGVMIQVYKNMNGIRVEREMIHAQAGAMLSVIAKRALEQGLTGMESVSGIPGTLGGAVVIRTVSGEEMEFGYRTSCIMREKAIVLEAVLKLAHGDCAAIRERMEELKEMRVGKQPLDLPSAGSTFKRPEGYFAGKLIMDAGLRGFAVGGAQVSEKHCGFVVNRGGATAADVRELMRQVQERVQAQFGVWLEPEVRMLGEF